MLTSERTGALERGFKWKVERNGLLLVDWLVADLSRALVEACDRHPILSVHEKVLDEDLIVLRYLRKLKQVDFKKPVRLIKPTSWVRVLTYIDALDGPVRHEEKYRRVDCRHFAVSSASNFRGFWNLLWRFEIVRDFCIQTSGISSNIIHLYCC